MSIDLDKSAQPTPEDVDPGTPPTGPGPARMLSLGAGVAVMALICAIGAGWLSPDRADRPITPSATPVPASSQSTALGAAVSVIRNLLTPAPGASTTLHAYRSVQDCFNFHNSDGCRLAFMEAAARKPLAPSFATRVACLATYAACMPEAAGKFTPAAWGVLVAWNWDARYASNDTLNAAAPVFMLRTGGYQTLSSRGQLHHLQDIRPYWQSAN